MYHSSKVRQIIVMRKWHNDDVCFIKLPENGLAPGRVRKHTKKNKKSGWVLLEMYYGNERQVLLFTLVLILARLLTPHKI